MTVEVVNTIGDFDITNPKNGDIIAEGDDHIRNIKKGVLGSFAGKMDTAITTTDDQFNFLNTATSDVQAQIDALSALLNSGAGFVPIGAIIPYNGAFANIPANFQLCDGTNGTPDMTDSFAFGTNLELELNDTGGSNDAVNITHTHILGASGIHFHVNGIGVLSQDIDPSEFGTTGGYISAPRFDKGSFSTTVKPNTSTEPDHNHSITTNGVDGTDLNRPLFVKFAYIRRMI